MHSHLTMEINFSVISLISCQNKGICYYVLYVSKYDACCDVIKMIINCNISRQIYIHIGISINICQVGLYGIYLIHFNYGSTSTLNLLMGRIYCLSCRTTILHHQSTHTHTSLCYRFSRNYSTKLFNVEERIMMLLLIQTFQNE